MSIKMDLTYPKELEKAKAEKWPILIPVGTMEYHSAICPFGCDTLTAIGLADRIAQKIDCIVMPPIYYGVASYAVGGPEKNTIQVDCDTFENYVYSILKSLFKSGLNRNIYMIICHQTEDYNPMELACMKAARKLIFEYLEETVGYGWWGKNENKDFYESLKGEDNPWNWVHCIHGLSPKASEVSHGGDHAGPVECGMLETMFPGTIKLERLSETDDWFSKDAIKMDLDLSKKVVDTAVNEYVEMIKKQKGEL